MSTRRDRPRRPWFLYALAVLAIAVAGLAITEIGAPASSARTSRQVVSAAQGVVQSTVTGSGNVAAGTDVNVNFNTSGTLQDVYVHVGQHVNGGQFLADLDPTAAQLSLDQAKESLTAAEDNLSCVQGVSSDYGSGSGTGTGSGTASGSGGSSSTTSDSDPAGTVEYAAFRPPAAPPTARTEKKTSPRKEPTRTVTVTVTVPNQTRPATSSTTSTTSTPSPGSIASAQAAVYSAQAGVHNAEAALNNTKLYAPVSGTIAWLSSLTSGDAVSGGGSGSSSSSGSSSGTTAGSLAPAAPGPRAPRVRARRAPRVRASPRS